MGAYLTISDLTSAIGTPRLSQLCPNTSGTVSTAVVSAVILRAESEVNSILGPGFTVPITSSSVTTVIKSAATDIAVHYCYKRVTEFRGSKDGKTPVYQDYMDALDILREIRNGTRDGGSEATAAKSSLAGGTVYSSTQSFIIQTDEDTETPTGGF